MKNSISRRNFLEYMALMGAGAVVPGCVTTLLSTDTLPTNTLKSNEIMSEDICTNEDAFEIPRTNIFGRNYFKMPLPSIVDSQRNILNTISPPVYLIPEDESRMTETLVGEKGKGEIVLSSPTGNKYFPFAVMKELASNNINYKPTLPQNAQPLEIITSYKMGNSRTPLKNQGVSIDILNESDFPFYNENVIKILKQYKKDLGTKKGKLKKSIEESFIIMPMNDSVRKYSEICNDNTLPFVAMSIPLSVIYDRSAKDNLIRLKSNTYVFVKGNSVEEYVNKITKSIAPNSSTNMSAELPDK